MTCIEEIITVKIPTSFYMFQHRFKNAPIFKLKSYGERSFTFAAPTEWNKLPLDIKKASSIDCFKKKLKTYLYKKCFG